RELESHPDAAARVEARLRLELDARGRRGRNRQRAIEDAAGDHRRGHTRDAVVEIDAAEGTQRPVRPRRVSEAAFRVGHECGRARTRRDARGGKAHDAAAYTEDSNIVAV